MWQAQRKVHSHIILLKSYSVPLWICYLPSLHVLGQQSIEKVTFLKQVKVRFLIGGVNGPGADGRRTHDSDDSSIDRASPTKMKEKMKNRLDGQMTLWEVILMNYSYNRSVLCCLLGVRALIARPVCLRSTRCFEVVEGNICEAGSIGGVWRLREQSKPKYSWA